MMVSNSLDSSANRASICSIPMSMSTAFRLRESSRLLLINLIALEFLIGMGHATGRQNIESTIAFAVTFRSRTTSHISISNEILISVISVFLGVGR